MNDFAPFALAELYSRYRTMLLAEHPEIDPDTLADTMEGINNLPDIITNLVRASREDEASAAALKSMIDDMQERKARFEKRADKRRDMVRALMEAAELPKVERPDFTVSLRNNPPRVVITDDAVVPDQYCRISRLPNLNEIRSALKNNVIIPGASLSNGGVGISTRWK